MPLIFDSFVPLCRSRYIHKVSHNIWSKLAIVQVIWTSFILNGLELQPNSSDESSVSSLQCTSWFNIWWMLSAHFHLSCVHGLINDNAFYSLPLPRSVGPWSTDQNLPCFILLCYLGIFKVCFLFALGIKKSCLILDLNIRRRGMSQCTGLTSGIVIFTRALEIKKE